MNNFSVVFEGTNFNITNGSMDSNGGSYALFVGDLGTTSNVVISNISMTGGINVYNATGVILRDLTVNGTTYYAVWSDEGANIQIESGSYSSSGNAVLGLAAGDVNSSMNIIGGSYFAAGTKTSGTLVLEGTNNANESYGAPTISGGIYDVDPSAYVAAGTEMISLTKGGESDPSSYGVGETSVTALSEKAVAGDTVVVMSGSVNLTLPEGVAVTNNSDSEIVVNGTSVPSNESTDVHEWNADYTVDKSATCTTEGRKSIHCAMCDEVRNIEIIPATGHNWDSGKITKEATCTQDGLKTYTCLNDSSHTYTEAITAVGHIYGEPSFIWSSDGKTCNASFKCVNCNDVQIVEATMTSDIKTAATATQKGITTYTAKVVFNGVEYTDTKDIADIPIIGSTDTDSLKTGEDSNLILFIVLLIIGSMGLTIATVYSRKSKTN